MMAEKPITVERVCASISALLSPSAVETVREVVEKWAGNTSVSFENVVNSAVAQLRDGKQSRTAVRRMQHRAALCV